MAPPQQPITAARFSITVDGYEIASFSELQGIKTEIKTVDWVESGEKGLLQTKMPGNPELATLQFKRGQNASMELWAWHEAARMGQMDQARKTASLVMYDPAGKPVARYHLENAWVPKIEIGSLKAGSNEVLMESVTLVCDHLQRVSP